MISVSALQLLCKEILFLHPSKNWSIESYTFIFSQLHHSNSLCLQMNEKEYNHCIFNAMNIITLHIVAPRLLQTSCKMTRFPWTDPQMGLYQEAPRQLWALQEEWKGSQWDSSEKEFPEENRLTQGIRKHYKTFHTIRFSHWSCSMHLQKVQTCSTETSTGLWTHQGWSPAWVGSHRRVMDRRAGS